MNTITAGIVLSLGLGTVMRVTKRRGDFWGILQRFEEKATKQFAKTTTHDQIDALEREWTEPEKGIIARLERKPDLSEASPGGRRIFVDCLKQHIFNHARYARIWLED